jgi:hypothetical protein
MNTAGRKTGCAEEPNSYLRDVRAYLQQLLLLKPAEQISVTGLWTLPSVSEGASFVVVQDPLIPDAAGLRVADGSQAACQSSSDPSVVGYPQLRLTRFVSLLAEATAQAALTWNGSICEPTRYLETLGQQHLDSILCKHQLIGMSHQPLRAADGTPSCVVGDVSSLSPLAIPTASMPYCGTPCCQAMEKEPSHCGFFRDDVIAACASEPQSCYCIVGPDKAETSSAARFGVWRPHGAESPPETVVSVHCASKTQ